MSWSSFYVNKHGGHEPVGKNIEVQVNFDTFDGRCPIKPYKKVAALQNVFRMVIDSVGPTPPGNSTSQTRPNGRVHSPP